MHSDVCASACPATGTVGISEVSGVTGQCFPSSLVYSGWPTSVLLQELEKKLKCGVRKHSPSGDFAVMERERFLGRGPWQNMVRVKKTVECVSMLSSTVGVTCVMLFFLPRGYLGKIV